MLTHPVDTAPEGTPSVGRALWKVGPGPGAPPAPVSGAAGMEEGVSEAVLTGSDDASDQAVVPSCLLASSSL